MPSQRFQRLEALFHGALERPADERGAWLSAQCGPDLELRAEVERLIAASPAESFLTGTGALEARVAEVRPEPVLPDQVGPYRIVGELGHGGMGTVYLAVREGEGFEKKVALKLIRSGLAGDLVRQRLLAERQILAGLEHPGIAHLYDGGTTDDGQPYLVLEHVQGQHLTEYCEALDLGVEERVRLLVKVCEAVHYAHQRLVVHRDLKPSNILVTAEGQPKLLDFGIAKLIDPTASGGAGPVTSLRWMTPDYASPEQVRGQAVTTASDVYSLGVILYELLAGRRPYRLTTGGVHEIEQAVLTQEPARPSTATLAERRRRLLRGDLDQVVLKALDKDPARRYATAAELSDDLRRYLAGQPVRAQVDSFGYRAGKFVGRHRLAVAAVTLAALSLVVGAGVALRQAQHARASAAEAERHRQLAERRFQDVRTLANTYLFEFHDAIAEVPGATEARALVLRRGLEFLDKLAEESGSNADLKDELAQSYVRLAQLQGATLFETHVVSSEGPSASLAKAVALAEATHALQPREPRYGATLTAALLAQGQFHLKQGDPALAEDAFRRAVEIAEALLARRPQAADLRERLIRARLLRGIHLHLHAPLEQAEAEYRRALDLARDLRPAWRSDVRAASTEVDAVSWLHFVAGHQERWEEALAWAEELVRLGARRLAEQPSVDSRRSLAFAEHDAGWALIGLGRPAEALARLNRALATYERLARENPTDVLPPEDIARSREIRADALAALGRLPEALDDLERALATHEAGLAREPGSAVLRARVAWALRRHGELSLQAGRHRADALSRLQRARQLLEQNLSRDPQATFDSLNRARVLSTLARETREASLHRAALAAWKGLADSGRLPASEGSRLALEEQAVAALAAR